MVNYGRNTMTEKYGELR